MTPAPLVIARHDALDQIVAWSTVAAAVLALVALFAAMWSVRHADRALMRERQMTFELGVLAQLAHACGNLWNGSASEVLALIALLPGELDGLRAYIEQRLQPEGPAFAANEQVLRDHWPEYSAAIARRTSARRQRGA
jgi:hypothetical protein